MNLSNSINIIVTNLRANRQVLAVVFLVSCAFVFCFARAITTLVQQWWSNEIYSYGFLIPAISAYFVWLGRKELLQLPLVPNYPWGLSIFFFSLFLLLTGEVGGVVVLQWLSLIVSLIGLLLFFMGAHFLRKLWFPIAYLLFMIPYWEIVTDRIHLPFQKFSAVVGTILLKFANIPVFHNEVFMQLPNITLEVARACSGVSYLLAVVAISVPAAIFFVEGWFRRGLLICFAVIVAILSNGLRVALIGFLFYHRLSGGNLHGPYHILQGLFVSAVGYVAIFFGIWILSERSSTPFTKMTKIQPGESVSELACEIRNLFFPAFCTVVLLILVGSYIHFHKPSPTPLKMALDLLPVQIGEWHGKDIRSSYGNYREMGVDQELSRVYETSSGDSVRLYVGYFEYQKQTKELINYLTTEMHNGATKIKVAMNSGGYIEVNKVIHRTGNRNRLTLFWYDFSGRVVTDKYLAKAYTVWDAFTRGRTNGAVIIVTADVDEKNHLSGALAKTENFAGGLCQVLRNHLPKE